jgi:hypothetical protein
MAFVTMRISHRRAMPVVALAAGLACAYWATTAWAQKASALANRGAEIKKILREPEILSDPVQKRLFEDYFKKYFLQQFVTPGGRYSIDELPKVRKDLRLFFTSGKSGPGYDLLNEMVLEKMKDILKNGKFGPNDAVIKYNAMLVIGDLNAEEGDAKNAKPLPAALPILQAALQSPQDSMKVAALVGLDRFAGAGAIPQAKAAELTKTLLDLLNQQDPPAGRDAPSHDYLRRNAAQVLTSLGSPGPNDSVVKAFEAIASDPTARPTLRRDLAQFIGQLKYPPNSKVDYQQLANVLGHQTVEVCKRELEAAKAAKRPASRRLIMYSLNSVIRGLAGLNTAAKEGTPAKEFIAGCREKLFALYKALDSSDLVDDAVAAEVAGKISELESLLLDESAAKKEELMAAERKEKPVDPAKQ